MLCISYFVFSSSQGWLLTFFVIHMKCVLKHCFLFLICLLFYKSFIKFIKLNNYILFINAVIFLSQNLFSFLTATIYTFRMTRFFHLFIGHYSSIIDLILWNMVEGIMGSITYTTFEKHVISFSKKQILCNF